MNKESKGAPQKGIGNMPNIGPRGPMGGGPMAARLHAEKPKNTKKTLIRLFKYIGGSRLILAILAVAMLFVTALELASPFLQQQAIDTIKFEGGRLTLDLDRLKGFLVIMGSVALLNSILSYMNSRLAAKLSQATVYTLRNELFAKITKLPIKYIDSHKHGDIMSRMTNDVENVSSAVSQSVISFFSGIITLVGAFSMMLYYSPIMTLAAVVTIPLTIFVTSKLAKFMRKYFVNQQRLLGGLNSQIEETVTSFKTVVAYGKEGESVEKFAKTSSELLSVSVKARVWGSVMGPIMNFIGNLQYLLIATCGGWLMIAGIGRVTIGSIQATLQYSKKFTRPINEIANQYSNILTALAGAERIFEIIDSGSEPDEGDSRLRVSDIRGEIEFKDVDFGYSENRRVLKNFNLTVKAGEKIAIVGATGSGKTTIVNLLTRFYELNGGEIRIDGVNITKLPKATLRKAIAIVLQDTVLFSDTIRENIKYGRQEASDEEMESAARTARADEFIERLPDKYGEILTESGGNLSMGQRQLLAIARAVIANPKILILDEATSSVDTSTEMQIQHAMVALMKNRTSLIIAHRLSTIRDADKIVVIKDGAAVESGSHGELLARSGEYSKLYQKQFAGIET